MSAVYARKTALVSFGAETWNMIQTAAPGRFTAQGRQWEVRAFPDHEEGVLSVSGARPTPITRCQRRGARSPAAVVAIAATGGVPACGVADLSIKLLTRDPGAGQRNTVFAVKNRGQTVCSVQGFPAVTMLEADGRPAHGLKGVTSTATGPASGPPAALSLAPGARAVFYLHYTVVSSGDEASCPQVSRLKIDLPGGRSGLVPLEDRPCGGRFEVSPLRKDPGTPDGL